MDKIYTENPVINFLDEQTKSENLEEVVLGDKNIPMNKPYIAYKQHLVRIPQNFLAGTEYAIGGYKIGDHPMNLTSNVQIILRTLNTIQENIAFQSLYQIPSISKIQGLGIEENKQVKEILQKHLTNQVEQLEINRKNIKNDVNHIENISKKQYETLYKHQESILNILVENKKSNEISEEIKQVKIDLKNLKENVEKDISEIKKLISELGNKL